MFRMLRFIVGCLLIVIPGSATEAKRPNVVFILTDNQGAWQLGCYGNPDFKTPHIDRLAAEGMRFTRAFSNNPVCSPTRATYLTGLTPSQHGVHRFIPHAAQMGDDAYNTIGEFETLSEILTANGYVCGLSGKWHLGANLHPQDGFTFWTTKPVGSSEKFIDEPVIDEGKVRREPKHLTEYWTDRGIEFIKANADEEAPFFLFLAYNGPYGLSGSMFEKVPSPWSDPYVDNPLASLPRPKKVHPWQINQQGHIGNIEILRNLAGQVTAVDAGVGRILEALDEQGLTEETLVVYAADQGAVAGHAGFWGMGDHTKPLHLRDGTLQIPLIFKHPQRIAAKTTADELVTNYDFMPTMLSYLDLPTPQDWNTPGRDYTPVLTGEEVSNWDNVLFAEFENVRAIRTGDWKYVERLGEEPNRELFNLKRDADELNNVVVQHPSQAKALESRMDAWFAKYSVPKWNLWTGGESKANMPKHVQEAFAAARAGQ